MIGRPPRRAAAVAVLLAGAIAGLLAAWFASGWRDVRARQRELRAAPVAAAEARAGELARSLRGELEALLAREAERPYFHYQNLFHDPRGTVGISVAPSPLASGPDDPLVLGHFQVDAAGRVTTPTINDEVPELSERDHLAANRRFRDDVARELAAIVRPAVTAPPAVVAVANPPAKRPPPRPQPQVIQIDPGSYAQNAAPNAAWQTGNQAQPSPPPPPPPAPPAPPAKPAPVTITVSPLEWKTARFEGAPALFAVRRVTTPDGTLAQGFVVDRATLTHELAERAGELVGELHAGDGVSGAEVAPGWQLTVAANPRALAGAAAEAAAVAREFVIRFVAIALVAALIAVLVVVVVARAERLARERSQFAAAAAHELRTPLAGLQLYGDMLADGLGDPDKAREYAKRMSEEASRLGRVVSNVLGFSQLERGTLGVDARAGSLGEALRELAERAQPALDRAGAALELDVAPELRARFDRDALARIVANLLDNAEKYARGADDRTIALVARDVGDRVDIEVSDRGPGVADSRRLFEAFRRGVDRDGPAGLGLGLALSRSLARAMGGDLAYRGSGTGATFVLTLPRA
ncbi:MAG: sensor histidine kinase [Acidobacteriota bacterium]